LFFHIHAVSTVTGFTAMQQIRCEGCGQLTASHDIVNFGSTDRGYKQLCSRCFNSEVASLGGLDKFEHVAFEPAVLTDSTGNSHEFHFRTHLYGHVVALDAFELRGGSPAGYQFQVVGDPEDDLVALLGHLIEKMRHALAVKHVDEGDFGLRIADHLMVRGRIDWDEASDGGAPLLVIDGREITWDEFGRMVAGFEGFQFKLEIRDRSEEV
jgi:hypothetical protein